MESSIGEKSGENAVEVYSMRISLANGIEFVQIQKQIHLVKTEKSI